MSAFGGDDRGRYDGPSPEKIALDKIWDAKDKKLAKETPRALPGDKPPVVAP